MTDEKPHLVPATTSVQNPTENQGVATAQSACQQLMKDHHLTAPNEGTN